MVNLIDTILDAKSFKGKFHKASEPCWTTRMLSTGILPVDRALGGGFGFGRLAEIFGGWSTGKTMLLYYALATNQKQGGVSAIFEAEGAFTPNFYSALGGDPDTLLVYPVDTVEEVFQGFADMAKIAEKTPTIPIAIGWDGIAATGTKHLQETGPEVRDMSKSGAMSQGAQYIATKIRSTQIAIIATNQVRDKIGDMSSETHTPGGKSWPFIASQRVELALDGGPKGSLIWNDNATEIVGRHVLGTVIKNKLATPLKRFAIPIYIRSDLTHPLYDKPLQLGIDCDESLFTFYKDKYFVFEDSSPVILGPNGSWYELNKTIGDKRFQRKDWPKVLAEFPQLRDLPNVLGKRTSEVVGSVQESNELDVRSDNSGEGSNQS